MNSTQIGHYDLLFTVLYAAVASSIFNTVSAASLWSFSFFMSVILLTVVIDHWILHNRNKRAIFDHPYFSLFTIILVLFFYSKLNHILSAERTLSENWHFWIWVILLFFSDFMMKRYYKDSWFYRRWDIAAAVMVGVYLWGMLYQGWSNGFWLGLISFLFTIVYLGSEIYHRTVFGSGENGTTKTNSMS